MIKNEHIDFIKTNCTKLPREEIDHIYNIMSNYLKTNDITIRIQSLILIINKIFEKINLQTITKLEDFTFVKKNIFFSKDNDKVIEENIDILFGPFCKTKYKYYMRTNYKSYFYSFLKNACAEIGYELVSSKLKKDIHCSILKNQ